LPQIECLMVGLQDTLEREVRFTHANGHTVWSEISVSLIRAPDGAPVHAVALINDISRSHHDEAAHAALEAQLHQAQRLDGLGRLAGGVAHDFNNLLAVIISYAALVAEGLPDDDRRADVEQILEAVERASALTRQLLTFGRRDVVQPEALDLDEVVADTKRLLRRTLGEHIDLRVDGAASLPPVRADRSQLEQVLLNLAVNARDAMPDGGAITLRTSASPGDDRVHLTVTDTGCGMEPQVADRAFEPFFTTKPAGAGSGLGLATVYGIVTRSGGRIELTTAPGAGAASTSRCPLRRAAPRPRPSSRRPRRPGAARRCCSSRTSRRCARSPPACSATAATACSRRRDPRTRWRSPQRSPTCS
jgi:signal transduction histidine kinase